MPITRKSRPAWWLRAWSHLRPVLLEQTGSALNPVLEITLNKGRYMLCSENAIYSYEDLYDNFVESFRRLPLDTMPVVQLLRAWKPVAVVPMRLPLT